MDLRDYAHLVIDLASDQPIDGPFSLELSQVKLVSGRKMPGVQKQPEIKENVITRVKDVIEGWATKYGSANIGFGIVVGLALFTAILGCLMFTLNYFKVKS